MNFNQIGSNLNFNLTEIWEQVAAGYQSTVVPPIRFAFNSISRITGPVGAHVILGAAAVGLFYLGHRIWHMKMGTHAEDKDGGKVMITNGPNNRLLQLMLRIAGLMEMLAAATIAGGLITIAGGSVPLAIGVTGGIALLGLLV